jgi:hypothetical protein
MFSFQSRQRAARRRQSRRSKALLEIFEPRLLLSGNYLVGDFTGSWAFDGLNKAGSLTSDGNGNIIAGSWTNQDGSGDSVIVADAGSNYAITTAGSVTTSLDALPGGSTVSASTALTGLINATRDVIALNEGSLDAPAFNGLDLLVNHAGSFADSDIAGTWNIAAQDYRGTVTINASGHVTGGQIFLESNQKAAKVTGGAAVLNADGTGTLTINTAFSGANAAFSSLALAITMDAAKDTMVSTNAHIGEATTGGTVPAELGVFTKTAGTYSSADVEGATWTIDSALGTGSFTFNANKTITGTLHSVDGSTEMLTGNYAVGGNGTLTTNITETNADTHAVSHFSLFGAINRSRNLIAMDRSIANNGTNASLTVLISATNHIPTERAQAVLPQSAYQSSAITIDFPTLVTATSVNDFDNDTLSFLVTSVPASNGILSITHEGVTTAVNATTNTYMVAGDTLTWMPSPTAPGDANAFDIQAFDGSALAANATQIFVNASALPLVSAISNHPFALEADAANHKGDAVITIQRAGDQTNATTVTLSVGGDAVQGTNYELLGTDDATVLSSATPQVVIPAGKNSVNVFVHALDDGVADPTLDMTLTVVADPNGSSPSYTQSVHATAHTQIIDKNPIVTITPRQPSILEGSQSVNTFIVTRLAAQGANLNGTASNITVNLAYSGTFDTADDLFAPISVTFGPGEVKKIVRVTTVNDNIADPTETLIATISGTNFVVNGSASATVNVLDASPVVSVSLINANAVEGQPSKAARFVVKRTGSTADALTVDFTTSHGGLFGTLGTNYTLTDGSGNSLTNAVVIPADKNSEVITLTAIDDGMNDPTLHSVFTLEPDAGPSYHVATPGSVTMNILNNNRRPTIANATASASTPSNTALDLSYDQLISLTGAELAPGETNGTLQLEVTAEFKGMLQLIPDNSTTAITAVVGTIIDSGDTLVWTPAGHNGDTVPAFALTAVDGTLVAKGNTRFSVTLSAPV